MGTSSEVKTEQIEVGGAVKAKCGKCKQETAHTVLAMVDEKPSQVRCTICERDHKFRAPAKPRVAKKPRVPKVDPEVAVWLKLSPKWDNAKAIKYNIGTTFAKNDLINHPKFGMGQVQQLLDANKMRVLFETGIKLMVHSR